MRDLLAHVLDISGRADDMFGEEGEPTQEWDELISKIAIALDRSRDTTEERKELHDVIWADLDTCIGRIEGYEALIQRFVESCSTEVLRKIVQNEEEDGDAEED